MLECCCRACQPRLGLAGMEGSLEKESFAGGDLAPVIAVVGPDESLVRLLKIKLARAGFAVLSAADLEGGIDLLSRSPSLVLLDAGLPRAGGLEFARLVSTLPVEARPAVVLLSEDASPAAIGAALGYGCDDYVTKPFSPTELLHRLRVVLIRRELGRAVPAALVGPDPS